MRVHWRVKGESRNRARLHQEGLRSIPDIPWDPATEGGGLGLKRLGLLQVRRGPQRPVAARGAVRDRTSDQIERTTPQSQRVGRIGWVGRRKNWCSRRAGAVGRRAWRGQGRGAASWPGEQERAAEAALIRAASGRERPTRTEVQTSVKDEVKDVHGESVKDAEAEEEVGEERISVSLLRETSGLSRVRAPTPIVIGGLVSLGFTPMHLR